MAVAAATVATSDFDPFSSETRRNPYGFYEELRAAGSVVRLSKYGIWAVPKAADVKTVLDDPVNFSSAGGAGLANYFKQKPWRPPALSWRPIRRCTPERAPSWRACCRRA